MKKFILSLIIIFIFVGLVGCTAEFKVNEKTAKDISDKITQNVIDTVDSKIKAIKQETHTLGTTNSTQLNIESEVGDIDIITHDLNIVLADISIKAKSSTKQKAEELINNFKYTVEANGNAINIDTTGYNNMLNNDKIIVDLSFKIPKTIENITITSNVGDIIIENTNGIINASSDVGDINIKNSNALYDINTDVGDINLENSLISGTSKFYLNVGDINVSANDITNAESISIESQVGDINVSLPQNSNYEASINEFLNEPKTKLNGNGKTKITLTTSVGNIDFN